MDYPASQRRLILEDCEIYREQMCRTLPIKVRKLAAHPITLKDIARAAVKWRDTAQQTNEHNKRRTYFQRSAILALLSLTPLRIGDATRLLIGDHVKRDEAGWSLRISSEKSGYRHNGRLHSSLTPYLDDLLLYGEGGSVYLHYAQRVGGPLFATEMHEYLSSRTLAYNFKVATGHSPHIVRTLVHDAMAKFGTYGADLARILCGQRSLAIGKHYEVYAARLRAEEAQKSLAEIQAKIIPIAPPATDNFRDGPRV
ncbi:hypothetical protein [Phaeovulum sp. NW3]|uniref:hypothetical protein n=1 Tax=Phaeovulum sp. NW3 TaxID=2934933 RepID=UPI0020226D0E|nr:hypothetical protein [Phaeovulum sp. NW3]MCL7466262.1 hypothetical protein [Phaeovulum sp. NW3]